MIEVRNINKSFHVPHEVKALVDVSTKISAAEVVVVCGPSGSGKSTFLRCLNRLEKADNGHILIDGIRTFLAKCHFIAVIQVQTDRNGCRIRQGFVNGSNHLGTQEL